MSFGSAYHFRDVYFQNYFYSKEYLYSYFEFHEIYLGMVAYNLRNQLESVELYNIGFRLLCILSSKALVLQQLLSLYNGCRE
jgi:hypothetical protein